MIARPRTLHVRPHVYILGVRVYIRAIRTCDSLHTLDSLGEIALVTQALEDLDSLVGHFGHDRQLHPFQKCLVVRNRHQSARVR